MTNLWLKIKIWTKVVVFGVVGLYVILFVNRNWNHEVDPAIDFPFFKNFARPRLLNVLLITAVVSIFGWWLFRTIFKTIRQIRDLRHRSRTAKLEKEVAEMRTKAGMLQTKDQTSGAATPASPLNPGGAAAPGGFPVIPLPVTPAPGTSSAASPSPPAAPDAGPI